MDFRDMSAMTEAVVPRDDEGQKESHIDDGSRPVHVLAGLGQIVIPIIESLDLKVVVLEVVIFLFNGDQGHERTLQLSDPDSELELGPNREDMEDTVNVPDVDHILRRHASPALQGVELSRVGGLLTKPVGRGGYQMSENAIGGLMFTRPPDSRREGHGQFWTEERLGVWATRQASSAGRWAGSTEMEYVPSRSPSNISSWK